MMKALVKTALLGSVLFLCSQGAKAQVLVGIEIGSPPPPRVFAVRPVAPGPDFLWVDGYWYPVNGHYHWHAGYWTRPPYAGARWVAPHHDGHSYFAGYWDGEHGRFEHDHKWDHDHDRDHGHYHD